MAAPKKALKKLSSKDVTMFRIANRKGYAAIARDNLCEGRTAMQAYERLIKACRRAGYELSANQLPAVK